MEFYVLEGCLGGGFVEASALAGLAERWCRGFLRVEAVEGFHVLADLLVADLGWKPVFCCGVRDLGFEG